MQSTILTNNDIEHVNVADACAIVLLLFLARITQTVSSRGHSYKWSRLLQTVRSKRLLDNEPLDDLD